MLEVDIILLYPNTFPSIGVVGASVTNIDKFTVSSNNGKI